MKNSITLVVLFTIMILLTNLLLPDMLLAQAPGLPGAPSAAPIDGGLALLAAAGGGYAIKKLRDRKE